MISICSAFLLPDRAVHSLAAKRSFEAKMNHKELVIRESGKNTCIKLATAHIKNVISMVGYYGAQPINISPTSFNFDGDVRVRVVNGLTLCLDHVVNVDTNNIVVTPLLQLDLIAAGIVRLM